MKRYVLPLAMLGLIVVTGCRIQVDKNKNGDDKNVKIDTPMGGLHVRTDQLNASDLGLPLYPGAQPVNDDNEKAADIHMGFGQWQLRVKVVTYKTNDSQDKVLDFYRKALGRYGDVIQCDHGMPVGTPTMTREGLTCSDHEGENHTNIHTGSNNELGLRAGSKRHQHLLEVKKTGGTGTHFSLVELELPADEHGDSQESQ